MSSVEILGYLASLASGGAFLPQSFRAVMTRQTKDLSLSSVALGLAGTVLWASYGVAIDSRPVALSNCLIMPFALATLVVKMRHG